MPTKIKEPVFGQKYKSQTDFDEPINLALREHVDGADDWEHHDFVHTMYEWAAIFNEEFFEIKKKSKTTEVIPTLAIGFTKLNPHKIATYKRNRNAYGIVNEVLFNTVWKTTSGINDKAEGERPFWHALVSLLHEMTHAWQHRYGEAPDSRVHNAQFISKMVEWGITTDKKRGATTDVEKGKFTQLLELKGVDFKLPYGEKRQTRTVYIEWTCKCASRTVRVKDDDQDGVSLLCTLCNTVFAPKGNHAINDAKVIKQYIKGLQGVLKELENGPSEPVDVDLDDLDFGVEVDREELKAMTVKELRAFAKPFGVKGKSKADLMAGLEANGDVKINEVAAKPKAKPKKKQTKKDTKPKNGKPKAAAKPKKAKKSKSGLPAHLESHFKINDEGTLDCEHCDNDYANVKTATRHLKNKHPDLSTGPSVPTF